MLFTDKFAVFVGISGSHFQTGKMKRSDRLHKACCNGNHLYNGEVNVTTGKQQSLPGKNSVCTVINSYMQQNYCMQCTLNSEFGTYHVFSYFLA